MEKEKDITKNKLDIVKAVVEKPNMNNTYQTKEKLRKYEDI